MTGSDIQRLLGALDAPAELVETHISWVILTLENAYKIKKPLHFSFLDFSELTQRKWYCEQELMLNRRLAPTVYLEVLPICKSGESIGWNAQGEVVDYAVKMMRLDAQLEMDRMLAAGRIDAGYMCILAAKIADFHLQATEIHTPQTASAAAYQADFNDILGQSDTIAQWLGQDVLHALKRVVERSDAFLQAHAAQIASRTEAGWVRDVHGDLHARNIFAYPDPVVFDCIEFNPHFRQIDVLNEIAFFCMDLEVTGFGKLAEVFLEAYLERCPAMPTQEDRALFQWFKRYRANVRAKVAALRLAQADATAQMAIVQEMRTYLDWIQ